MSHNKIDNLYPWLEPCFNSILPRITAQNLHHGLLFIADKGCGESTVCKLVAKALLCQTKQACGHCKSCLLFEATSHPDLLEVISDKPSIGVESIRQVSEFVNTTSQLLSNKVVLIEDIERMTDSASNALLKTLEEPNNNTYLILSTNQPDKLLATIKSRCEKLRLTLPNSENALDWLSTKTQEAVNELGLQAYSGSPIDYLNSLQQSDKLSHPQFVEDFANLILFKSSSIELADKWQSEANLALTWCYQLLVKLQEQQLSSDTNHDIFSNNKVQALNFNYEQLVQASIECHRTSKPMAQAGVNKSLALQRVFKQVQLSVFS